MIKKRKLWLLTAVMIIAAMSLFACAPAETLEPEAPPEEAATEAPLAVEPTEAPPPEEEPTEPPPPAEKTSITILIYANPAEFHGFNIGSGL